MNGRLKGGTIVKASLIGTCVCKQPLVSTFPGASGNFRDLQPIITKEHPSTWECSMSCLSMAADGVDFGCCVYTVRFEESAVSPVRCDVNHVITFIFSTNNYIW